MELYNNSINILKTISRNDLSGLIKKLLNKIKIRLYAKTPTVTRPIMVQNLTVDIIVLLSQSTKYEDKAKLMLIIPKGSPENRSKKNPLKITTHHNFLKSLKIIKRRTKIKTKLGLTLWKDTK